MKYYWIKSSWKDEMDLCLDDGDGSRTFIAQTEESFLYRDFLERYPDGNIEIIEE